MSLGPISVWFGFVCAEPALFTDDGTKANPLAVRAGLLQFLSSAAA